MPQGPNTINVGGNFRSGSLAISGGTNRINFIGNSTGFIQENVVLDGDGRLVLADNAGVLIGGTLTITNSGGNGTNQSPNTNLIVLAAGSSLAPGKTPSGGCFQTPENGVTCESNACVEVIDLFEGTEVVIIFRCNATWFPPEGLTQYEVLVVGGGGSGGRTDTANNNNSNKSGGGGGGGAVRFQVVNIPEPGLPEGEEYQIIIGQGGRSNGTNAAQRRGRPSTFSYSAGTITAGGGGGGANNTNRNGLPGVNGGSGGGAGAMAGPGGNDGNGGNGNNPGNRGGNSFSSGNSSRQWGGGGGGAGGLGEDVTNSNARGGQGGIGFPSSITGTPTRYAAGGGGGGSTESDRYGSGGVGGGGDGGDGSRLPMPGEANTGGGGGGGSGNNRLGGNGGSGVVIIRYEVARILPVDYIYFEGKLNESENQVNLKWATAKEWESSHFEIMRSFDNVDSWEKIGEVEAAGFSDHIQEYQFEDKDNFNFYQMAYYQLKQVDLDNSYHMSKVIGIQLPVNSDQTMTWKIYPNPVSNQKVHLSILEQRGYNGELVNATLVDPIGKSIQFTGTSLIDLSTQLNKALQQSGKGVYILNLLWDKNNQQLRILKN